ncbi:MAG: hypothetical protein F4W91_18205 [Gemmatimonadetes bacterium]|nr:hypothetical protein [Gemmatimonadota bacterium]
MNDIAEEINSVELDDMTRHAIRLVASEIVENIQGDLQGVLRQAATQELAGIESNIEQMIEDKIAEVEKRLLAEYGNRIDEVVAKQQNQREVIESTLAEAEKRLVAEHRNRSDKVESKLARTQYALLGLIAVTLLATITGIFL